MAVRGGYRNCTLRTERARSQWHADRKQLLPARCDRDLRLAHCKGLAPVAELRERVALPRMAHRPLRDGAVQSVLRRHSVGEANPGEVAVGAFLRFEDGIAAPTWAAEASPRVTTTDITSAPATRPILQA